MFNLIRMLLTTITKNKKILITVILIIVFAVVTLDLLNIYKAEAQGPLGPSALPGVGSGAATAKAPAKTGGTTVASAAGQAAFWSALIFFLLNLVLQVLNWIYGAAGVILNQAFVFATQPGWFLNDAITRGWALLRDLSNIWIILSLMVIAISTILRVESHSAKRTLV